MDNTKVKRNYAFDFLKVWFIVLIILHHGLVFNKEQLYLAVEVFFIISGYLLYNTYFFKKKTPLVYLYGRICRLWPKYIIIFILILIPHLIKGNLGYSKPYSIVWEIFMLQNIGLPGSGGINYPLWYISVLFVGGSLIYTFLFFLGDKKYISYIELIIIFGVYILMYCHNPNTLEQWSYVGSVVYLPFWRGIADMLIGVYISSKYNGHTSNIELLKYLDVVMLILVTIAMFSKLSAYFILVVLTIMLLISSNPSSSLQHLGKNKIIKFLLMHEYTAYLSHALIIDFFMFFEIANKMPKLLYGLLLLISVLLFSVVFDFIFNCIENFIKIVRK